MRAKAPVSKRRFCVCAQCEGCRGVSSYLTGEGYHRCLPRLEWCFELEEDKVVSAEGEEVGSEESVFDRLEFRAAM